MSDANFTHSFAATTGVQDFKFQNIGPAPEGYPTSVRVDHYSKTCFESVYDARRQAFVQHVLANPSINTIKGLFYELIRLDRSSVVHEGILFSALDYIDSRRDCADFVLAGVLRLLMQLSDRPKMPDGFLARAKKTVLAFKYWPDEPGIDSMCYWTENHHILFSSCEYLAGQLYPDEVFTNSGMTGAQKMLKAKPRIDKWLELRFYTGFNEWLSNVYYDENLPALLNLFDFALDLKLKQQAKNIIDLMLFDMALNSYYGLYVCTHGRTYTKEKTQPFLESTTDTSKLMFGVGSFANEDNMSAVMFALSDYHCPEVIVDIANSTADDVLENRQRVSINFSDAAKWGYGKLDLESAMGLLSFGGYSHPKTFNHMALMLDKFGWWDNQFFLEFRPFKTLIRWGRHIGLTKLTAWVFRRDFSRNSLEENNIYTYRTPDYMLSTSQDYRKSYGGDQHHIWQASLGGGAVCFTTHPGGYGLQAPNAYWHGNGFMPKAVQHKNVGVIIYNTPHTLPTIALDQTLEFTHAFFPQQRFDQVLERNGWVFAKQGQGYIALKSQNPARWENEGEYAGQDLIADGYRNIWLIEMGREAEVGSFETFVEQISSTKVVFSGLNVRYQSPSLGSVSAGWNKPLKVGAEAINVNDYPRYKNPFCTAEFESDEIVIEKGHRVHRIKCSPA